MGDDRNIVWSQIEAAADAAGISPSDVVKNIGTTLHQQAPA
jgi:hypothetical protein